MRLGGRIIEFYGLPRGALHFGRRIGTRAQAIDGAEAIGIGEPAPRWGVVVRLRPGTSGPLDSWGGCPHKGWRTSGRGTAVFAVPFFIATKR
jgi:hypothetical protein